VGWAERAAQGKLARVRVGLRESRRPTRGRERGIGGAGPRAALGRGKKERERGPAGKERRGGMLGWAGRLLGWAAFFYSFSFSSFFSNSLIQTILIEFKYNLNSNLYTQHK
jgi:hypothetical protein